jgi:ELWxxDGT repeat protein
MNRKGIFCSLLAVCLLLAMTLGSILPGRSALAQAPEPARPAAPIEFVTTLVKDLSPYSQDGFPNDVDEPAYAFVWKDGNAYLSADDGYDFRRELWKSDGSHDGTTLVKDINYQFWSDPKNFGDGGTAFYFSADDETHGFEPWMSDGTPGGTKMLMDLYSGVGSSDPDGFTLVGSQVFFSAYDETNGRELWKTDGTASGTHLVMDIRQGEGDSNPRSLIAFNGKLVFLANDGAFGEELWISDGVTIERLTDIYAGFNGSQISQMTVIGSQLFFVAQSASDKNGLYVSDGTPEGTREIHINAFVNSDPRNLTVFNGKLYFQAYKDYVGRELLVTDGTDPGTMLVKDLTPGEGSGGFPLDSNPNFLEVMGDSLYFFASIEGYPSLWQSEGSQEGTLKVTDLDCSAGCYAPRDLSAAGSQLFFIFGDWANGQALWRSDGTEQGTRLVKDIDPGNETDSAPIDTLLDLDGELFFRANDGVHGLEPWISDGTTDGTQIVRDIGQTGSGQPRNFVDFKGNLAFAAYKDSEAGLQELWTTAGTITSTTPISLSGVAPVAPYSLDLSESSLASVGGNLFFAGNGDGDYPSQLWVTDGTPGGNHLVKDLGNGIDWLTPLEDAVYFTAQDEEGIPMLWKGDGSETGAAPVSGMTGGAWYSELRYLFPAGDKLYYSYETVDNGEELWVTDGSSARMVRDLNTLDSSYPRCFSQMPDGSVIFSAIYRDNGMDFGFQVWRTDGTALGTTPLTLKAFQENTYPCDFHYWQDRVYFFAVDDTTGAGLFSLKLDGSELTYVVQIDGADLQTFNGKLYFLACSDDECGLYSSNGTGQGTQRIVKLYDAPEEQVRMNYPPDLLTVWGGRLFFTVYDGTHGRELWSSDGTAGGTGLVRDLNPGLASSGIESLTPLGDRLLFAAYDGDHGQELWSLAIQEAPGSSTYLYLPISIKE